MSFLLDAYVFLWFESGSARLSDPLRKTIADEPDVCVSAVSFWEIAIKRRTGKIELAALAAGFFELAIDGADVEMAGASQRPLQRRRRIVDLRKALLQRLHRLEQGDKSTLAHGLDHEATAVTAHDRFVAWQFELHRDADRLITAIAE